MANNYHLTILEDAFKKASDSLEKSGVGRVSKTQCAEELALYISEETNFPITNKTLRNYLNDLSEKRTFYIPQQKVLEGLSKYLGYNDYLEYVNSKDNSYFLWIKERWKPLFFAMMLLLAISFGTYKYFTMPKCMIWKEDHFEKSHCDIDSVAKQKVIPYDANLLLRFKKVHKDSINTFFTPNRDPLIWYGKNFKGEYEYFTALGFHPETGKTLKPITDYIIDKYINKVPK
ncbi:hypothetical protein KXJ69_05495 [Aureisphaera sp. CAU 1614]|uniref:Uncharacterized protein n=1 Tax=Halomarinibacterium sedimenti TaxID=2857106 RepID=A0A9X1JV35_9FLAO|nr:hypothetical protein [Halomarinibacterium sedimenti]MBW2937549.1 hypothetical protein [Halomarinibacterium sedimenti]